MECDRTSVFGLRWTENVQKSTNNMVRAQDLGISCVPVQLFWTSKELGKKA